MSAVLAIAGWAFLIFLVIVAPLAARHERVNELAWQALFSGDEDHDER